MLTAVAVHLVDRAGAPIVAGFAVLFACCLLNHPSLRPIAAVWGAALHTRRRPHR